MAGDSPDLRLLRAFEAYLGRQLGDNASRIALVEPGGRAPLDADVVVASGRRRPLSGRIFQRRSGLHPQWQGVAHASADSLGLPFTVWDRWDMDKVDPAPADFDVLAIVTTYNESEIIEQLLDRLEADRTRVHVIDNWSTDGTETLVEKRLARGRVTMERFPPEGPVPYFELGTLLARIEAVAHASGADWVMHHDADEVHESPWPGVSMRQGLWAVQGWGFNGVDHTLVDFRPVDDTWQSGDDLVTSFRWFEFGTGEGHFTLVRAWKPQPELVSNSVSGGHDAIFPGRRIFPYKFIMRHYPIRSQAQAERKIFRERRPRWSPEERAKKWHVQYDDIVEGTSFLRDRAALLHWSDGDPDLVLQRLSGVGLPNNPRPPETLG